MTVLRFGKYDLLGLLGTGGMGEVFLARQRGTASDSRLVAVKRILRHLSSDPSFVKMFLNEAKLAAVLLHPGIVQILELGVEGDDYFIAMEYVPGHNLRAVLRTLRARSLLVEPAMATWIALSALDALHYAHTRLDARGAPLGIVHRDVSPDNILVAEQGAIKLLDFGVAKALGGTTGEHSGVKGKLSYMAPEQLEGERVDHRADVYSMGCVLFEMLTGRPRVSAEGPAAVIREVLETEAPPLSVKRPGLPPALVRVVERALRRDRDERFSSAKEMTQALEEARVHAGAFDGPASVGRWLTEMVGAPLASSFLHGETAEPNLGTRVIEPKRPVVVATPAPKGDSSPTALTSPDLSLTPPRPRPRWRPAALGAILLLGGAVALRASSPGTSPQGEPRGSIEDATPSRVAASLSPLPVEPVPSSDSGLEPSGPVEPPVAVAAPPAVIERANKPVKKYGRITVLSQPWAEVFLNQRALGITPLTDPLEVPAGRQTLVLRNTELKLEKRVTVEVEPGATTEVKVVFGAR